MYAKLFTSIYQGTLRGNANGLLVFTNLLAHCDSAGEVDIHPRAIAEEVGLTVEQVKAALEVLESPDDESRSPEEKGRRIIRLDEHRAWGWRVVNYVKYRSIRSEEDRREQNRRAQAAYRQRQADSKKSKPSSAEGETDKPKQKQKQKQKKNYPPGPPQEGGEAGAPQADGTPPAAFTGEKDIESLNCRAVVPLAATWELPLDWGIGAEVLGWKPEEVLREAERFRQYWAEGKGAGTRRGVKGWRQSWSNWLAKAERMRR